MHIISYLKQARKRLNLTLEDMGYLLDMDYSNLAKYEQGKKTPPTRVIIAYHIITKTPLHKLFKYTFLGVMDTISSKTTELITRLEEENKSKPILKRLEALHEVLNNISCLKDVSEDDSYDDH